MKIEIKKLVDQINTEIKNDRNYGILETLNLLEKAIALNEKLSVLEGEYVNAIDAFNEMRKEAETKDESDNKDAKAINEVKKKSLYDDEVVVY